MKKLLLLLALTITGTARADETTLVCGYARITFEGELDPMAAILCNALEQEKGTLDFVYELYSKTLKENADLYSKISKLKKKLKAANKKNRR